MLAPTEYTNNECSICYDELGTKNTCTTPCGHQFCFNCMITALNHNNTCPCCRNVLKEEQEENSDEDSDWESEIDENDWVLPPAPIGRSGIPIRNNIFPLMHHEFLHNVQSNNNDIASPEIITKKIQDAGYNMEDIVSLWLQRIQRSKPRYDNKFVRKMITEIDNIIGVEDNEQYIRCEEQEMMGQEDHRTTEIENRDIFDVNPDINLSRIFGES